MEVARSADCQWIEQVAPCLVRGRVKNGQSFYSVVQYALIGFAPRR